MTPQDRFDCILKSLKLLFCISAFLITLGLLVWLYIWAPTSESLFKILAYVGLWGAVDGLWQSQVQGKLKERIDYMSTVLAGDQWWPRTSGGRLRFVRAITYLLRPSQNRQLCKRKQKESPYKRVVKFCVCEPPTCQQRGISSGLQPIRHI